jgi:hypothetical protein
MSCLAFLSYWQSSGHDLEGLLTKKIGRLSDIDSQFVDAKVSLRNRLGSVLRRWRKATEFV